MTTRDDNQAWAICFLNVPIFLYARQKLSSTQFFNPQSYPLSITDVFKGGWGLILLLLKRKRTKTYFFLMEREDLLNLYQMKADENSILIYRRELRSLKGFTTKGYPSFWFDVLRGVCLKFMPLIRKKDYEHFVRELAKLYPTTDLSNEIKVAMGEILYLRLLEKILNKDATIYYSGCVIPRAEKVGRLFQSWEVQHGIITPTNCLYQEAPIAMNGLVVYHEVYEKLLTEMGYPGPISRVEFKYRPSGSDEAIKYPTVIYTQPIPIFQDALFQFIKSRGLREGLFIQRHPRDVFDYQAPEEAFVNVPCEEVGQGLFLNSTVIEEFVLKSKPVVILKLPGMEYTQLLEIYSRFGTPDFRFIENLDEL